MSPNSDMGFGVRYGEVGQMRTVRLALVALVALAARAGGATAQAGGWRDGVGFDARLSLAPSTPPLPR